VRVLGRILREKGEGEIKRGMKANRKFSPGLFPRARLQIVSVDLRFLLATGNIGQDNGDASFLMPRGLFISDCTYIARPLPVVYRKLIKSFISGVSLSRLTNIDTFY